MRLNRLLAGWANYFCLGPVSKAYRAVDGYASARLRRWLCKKHQQPGQGTARYPDAYLYQHVEATPVDRAYAQLPVGNPMKTSSERRMRETRTSGATSGDWKRNYGTD